MNAHLHHRQDFLSSKVKTNVVSIKKNFYLPFSAIVPAFTFNLYYYSLRQRVQNIFSHMPIEGQGFGENSVRFNFEERNIIDIAQSGTDRLF